MFRNFKVLLFALAIVIIAGGAYAFAATNTVPDSAAGYKANVVPGYTVTGIVYDLDAADPTLVDAIKFAVAPSSGTVVAAIVKVQTADAGAWTVCTLVAGVAHELNTPIGNAVLAASTFADHTRTIVRKKESGLTRAALSAYLADASEGLAIMERNLHRAVELIQSFKQIAVDQTSSHTRRFLLDTLVSETLLTLSPSLKKSPIDVIRDIPTDIFLESFPGPLEQVLINLIDNAITHAFEGRTSGRIGISAKPAAPGWVEIVVEDDGVGISAENLRRIYDPFYTTKLGSGGAGLGLSVCQNVVTKILGGNIEVSSTPKVGTRFTISIPMQAGTSSNA